MFLRMRINGFSIRFPQTKDIQDRDQVASTLNLAC